MVDKFHELNDSTQIIMVITIIVLLISITICLITLGLRQVFSSRLSSRQQHRNVEYVILQNVDDHDDEETRSIKKNGYAKLNLPSETTISINHMEET